MQAGRLHAGVFPVLSAILAIGTIVICYVLAVKEGHVEPILPTISQCGQQAPERFILRIGLIPCAIFIAICWYLMVHFIKGIEEEHEATHHPDDGRDCCCCCCCCCCSCPSENVAEVLGFLGAILLIISESLLESDGTTPMILHVIGASGFFLCSVIGHILITCKLRKLRRCDTTVICWESMLFKELMVLAELVIVIANIYFVVKQTGGVFSNACEWLLTFVVIAYHLSFAHDFHRRLFIDTTLLPPGGMAKPRYHPMVPMGDTEMACYDSRLYQ